MATGTLRLIHGGVAASAGTQQAVTSPDNSDPLLNLATTEFAVEHQQESGPGCFFAVRFAILLEVLVALVIYGAWKLIH